MIAGGGTLVSSLGARLRTPAQWAVVAWWGVPVVVAALLATSSVTLPGDNLGFRRFQTPQLGPGMVVGQTFYMTGHGLHAVEVFPVAVGERVSGSVPFELYDVTGDRVTRVYEAVVSADRLIQSPSYRLEFPPIGNSADRSYRFDIAPAQAEGIAFWATKGERYAGGSMHINNQSRWADLAFLADAPAPSIWRLLMTLRETHPVRGNIVIGSVAAIWLLLGLLLRGITGTPDAAHITVSDSPATP